MKLNEKYNSDPFWVSYINRFEHLVVQVVYRMTTDEFLREDCMQEARMALLEVFPEKIDGHEKYLSGEYTEQEWHNHLKRYCGNVIRNAAYDYLNSYKTGNWYVGRTKQGVDPNTQEKKKVHKAPRFSSLDELIDDFGMQLSDSGEVAWGDVSREGLLGDTNGE
jgi:hypothetical protein